MDSENLEAGFQSSKERVSVSQDSRKSLEEEAPTLDSIPISLCDLGQVPSLLQGAGLAVAVVQHSDEGRK